ncbi:hypothetical protein HNY73_010350 [Argiope bruennichi]|uniref:Uncharacterized protein n=1 Tax=Argiope bruennichi TaxID=94029 RepID=A0A8T0F317_ARGBR|nr:hypothetical protein HNY73_010350 [Argiope bruennichi]
MDRTYDVEVITLNSRYGPDQLICVEVLIADTIATVPVAIPNADVQKNGRYEANLLWRTDPREWENNFSLAKRRFDELKKGSNKYKWITDSYRVAIGDQETNGIIEECGRDKNEYFMPHRAVIRADKGTTKVHVVLNCGSKSGQNFSLNNCLEAGLNLNPSILETDFKIVFYWIGGNAERWKQFVVNRVAEVQEKTNPNDWSYGPSADNPEDLLTRGISVENFISSQK